MKPFPVLCIRCKLVARLGLDKGRVLVQHTYQNMRHETWVLLQTYEIECCHFHHSIIDCARCTVLSRLVSANNQSIGWIIVGSTFLPDDLLGRFLRGWREEGGHCVFCDKLVWYHELFWGEYTCSSWLYLPAQRRRRDRPRSELPFIWRFWHIDGPASEIQSSWEYCQIEMHWGLCATVRVLSLGC